MASLFNIYRPRNFDEVVGQEATVKLLRQQALTGKFKQAYIFAGHFGSGKTSMARIFAMALNCSSRDEKGNPCGICDSCRAIIEGRNPDVVEYAASEQTGVEGADRLIASTQYAPVGKYKVYIIDEVQALSAQAFQRLLKITEEPPKNCVFIFCTTEFDSIPVANRSRMQKYNFNRFTNAEIAGRVRFVAKDAGLCIDDDVPEVIAKYSEASMRNAIVMLETAAEEGHVTGGMIEEIVGIAKSDRIIDIIRAVSDNDIKKLTDQFSVLRQGGFNINALVKELTATIADLFTWNTSRVCEGTYSYRELIENTPITPERLIEISDMLIRIKSMKSVNADIIFLGLASLIRLGNVPEGVQGVNDGVEVKGHAGPSEHEPVNPVVTTKEKQPEAVKREEKKSGSAEKETACPVTTDNPFDTAFDSPFGFFADDGPVDASCEKTACGECITDAVTMADVTEEPFPEVSYEDFSDEAVDYGSMNGVDADEGKLFNDEYTNSIEEIYRQDFYRENFTGLTESAMKFKSVMVYEEAFAGLLEYSERLKDGEAIDFGELEIALGRERIARFFCSDEVDESESLTGVDMNMLLARAKEDHTLREALLGVRKTGTALKGPKPVTDIISAFVSSYVR